MNSTSRLAMPLGGSERTFTFPCWMRAWKTANCYDYALGSWSLKRKAKSVPGDRAGVTPNTNFTTCRGMVNLTLEDNPGSIYQMRNPECKPRSGFFKVMAFVAKQGDFHWYVQMRAIEYRTQSGDTVQSLAKFFKVKPTAIVSALSTAVRPMSPLHGRISNPDNKVNKPLVGKGTPVRPNVVMTLPCNLWCHKQGWAGGPIAVDAKGNTIVDPRKACTHYPGLDYNYCSTYAVRRGGVATGANSNRE